MKQYWVAKNGSITLFDFKIINEEVEDFILEKWGNCEWGELCSFKDMRGEDFEEEDSSSEEEDSSSEDETKDDFAECCRCGEEDEGDGKQVDGEYWCVDCLEDAHQCELCKKYFEETEYLPSKEDQEKQQLLGNDYCLECYKKFEKFEFVEDIEA